MLTGKRRRAGAVVIAAALALTVGVATSVARSTHGRGNCWLGNKVDGAIRFCGPATARLSIFPGVTFRNGTCHKTVANGYPTLFLKLGARSLQNPLQKGGTNGGLPYLDISIVGPLSRLHGGGVIAFWKGKHWYGRGTSFRGTWRGGTFTARGIPQRGSHGTATGSFRC